MARFANIEPLHSWRTDQGYPAELILDDAQGFLRVLLAPMESS